MRTDYHNPEDSYYLAHLMQGLAKQSTTIMKKISQSFLDRVSEILTGKVQFGFILGGDVESSGLSFTIGNGGSQIWWTHTSGNSQTRLSDFESPEQLAGHVLNAISGEFPRRGRIDLLIPAEKVIYDAMQEVEKLPADIRLTNAVVLLGDARNWVADYVDDTKRNIDSGIPGTAKPENQIDNETEKLLVEFGNYLFQKYDVQVFSNDGKNTPLYQRGIHDADIKNFYHQYNLTAPEMKLPSKFQNGDKVQINYGLAGIIRGCEVVKVHFPPNVEKEQYDVSVKIPNPPMMKGLDKYTKMYNVDSAFVEPAK